MKFSMNINTKRMIYYPYIHGDGYLYFSSIGRPGMGGFDCYESMDDLGLPVGDVENMLSH